MSATRSSTTRTPGRQTISDTCGTRTSRTRGDWRGGSPASSREPSWPCPVTCCLRFTRTGRLVSWGNGDSWSWHDDALYGEIEPHRSDATAQRWLPWPEPGAVLAPPLGYDEMRRPSARRVAPAGARDGAVPWSAGPGDRRSGYAP